MKQKISNLLAQNKYLIQNLIGNIIPIIIGIIAIPLLHKHLGEAKFGVLVLIWITSNLVSILDFGIVRFITQKLTKFNLNSIPEEIIIQCRSMVVLLFCLSLFLSVGGLFLKSYILNIDFTVIDFKEASWAYYITIATIPFILLTSIFRGMLESQMLFKVTNLIKIPMMSFFYIIPYFVCVLFSSSLVAITFALAIGRLFFMLVHVHYVKKIFPSMLKNWKINRKELYSNLGEIRWLGTISTLAPVLGFMDRFFVNTLISTTMIGFYATPYEIVSRMSLLSASLASVLIPVLVRSFAISEIEAIRNVNLYIQKIFFLLLPPTLLFAVFSREILLVWMGETFATNSFQLLSIFSVGMLLNSVCSVPYSFLQINGEQKKIGILYLGQILVYPFFLWLGIKEFGMLGAAIAWFLRIIIDLIFFLLSVEAGYLARFFQLKSFVKMCALCIFLISCFANLVGFEIKCAGIILFSIECLRSFFKNEAVYTT